MNKLILYTFIFLFALTVNRKATAQQIRNTYKFYNTLSTTEPDCANALIPTQGLCVECQSSTAPTSGQFVLDTLRPSNISRTVYHNNLNWGLKYLNTDGVIGNNYTVQMYIRVVNFNKFYTRIIDFSDGIEDNGLYFTNYNTPPPTNERCLNFYPNGNFGTCPFFNNNTYYLLTITRNDITKKVDIYVNDQLFTSYSDVANFYVGAAGRPVHIFRDDPVGFACEDGEANFAYLSFANYYSTLTDVVSIYQNITIVANTADFSLSAYPRCFGKDITVNYAGDIPANATQYMFNWNWDGGTVITGTGRGPYIINWPTAGTKTITLSISGGACVATITNNKKILIGQDAFSTIDTSICIGGSIEGYTSPGSYSDQFLTALGCDSTRTLNLALKPCGIYFPSAFTPNVDGLNETFKVLGDNFISQYDLKVYNRYGEIVFKTTKPEIGWDGKFKGKDADIGVYAWHCHLKKPGSEQIYFFKGTITLLR